MEANTKQFSATGRAPYLGPFPGMVHCSDIKNLPPTATFVSLAPGCKNLAELPRLTHITRLHATLRDDLIEPLTLLPELNYLQLNLPKTDAIMPLTPLQRITTLVLRCNKHQTSLNFLKGMENLHSLCISEAMGISRLTPLSTLVNLNELYIDGTISGRNTITSLAPLSKLSQLRYAVLLVRVDKANRTLKHLHKLSKLEFLHLSDDYDEREYDQLLTKLPHLCEICFNAGKRWPRKS